MSESRREARYRRGLEGAGSTISPAQREPLRNQASRSKHDTAGRDIGCGGSWGQALAGYCGRMEQERRDDEKPDQAVEDMRSDVEEMEERSEELGDRIEETRRDWDSKQEDDAVPGAQPPPVDEAEGPPGDEPAGGGDGESGQQQEEGSGEEQSEEQSEGQAE